MPNHATKTALIAAIDTMRNNRPLVQCLTNNVVNQVTANVLLAAGATPAMCDTPEESAAFASVASGVLINPGTPSAEQYAGSKNMLHTPLKPGTGSRIFRTTIREQWLPKLTAFRPELVLLSAGFDGHKQDETGRLNKTDFGQIYCGTPAFLLLSALH